MPATSHSSRSAAHRRAAAAALLAVVLPLTACAGTSTGSAGATTTGSVGWHGVEPDTAPARPAFVLTDTTGSAYDFAARTKGRPTLLFFGYTDCPDECPTAMADIAAALRRTPAPVRDSTTVVFVTTDPARDDAARLRSWLGKFNTSFIGLTGSKEQVDAAQRAAGVRPATSGGAVPTLPGKPDEHVHAPGTAPHTHDRPLGYAVAHTTVIFAYDVDDRLPVLYPTGTTAADLAADLPLLAKPAGARTTS